jgi:hypothetical protein
VKLIRIKTQRHQTEGAAEFFSIPNVFAHFPAVHRPPLPVYITASECDIICSVIPRFAANDPRQEKNNARSCFAPMQQAHRKNLNK